MQAALARVDHLVLATPDLAKGIDFVRDNLGVEAVPGGHHPVYGTRNALVSLGDACYLEIIGPDNTVLDTEEVKVFGIHELARPALVTWSASGRDLEEFVECARREMIDLGAVTLGSRRQPDGRELTWAFTDPLAARSGGILPFFIDWGDTPHPGSSLDRECELLELSLYHPHAKETQRRLAVLGLALEVMPAEEPRVAAKIRTPKGDIDL
jgi:catechol 2,3-dioxygenase-like lactoylglutathione lyase family enzyme